jgi:hypothetical protein
MTPRQRIQAALAYRPVDKIPLRVLPVDGGLHEHGQRLLDLIRACGHDFGTFDHVRLPAPPPATDFDADGRYHAFRTDEWGTRWEYRIFGVWGHPVSWPIRDLADVDAYQAPPPPTAPQGPELESARRTAAAHKRLYFLQEFCGQLFERLHFLRPFEELLMDLAADEPRLHTLADKVLLHLAGAAARALAIGADGIQVGDDFGTAQSLIMSPATWRNFFKPRYRSLFAPLRAAGMEVHFHSCGMIRDILADMKDIGVTSIWPQLTLFDNGPGRQGLAELHAQCRDLGLAVELHPDRGDLMQRGTPREIRDYVLRMLDTFRTMDGGSWLYIEIDPGFPWPNVEAIFQVAMELRG